MLCRGLPFSATEEEVCGFFSGLEIVDLQVSFYFPYSQGFKNIFLTFSKIKIIIDAKKFISATRETPFSDVRKKLH